MTMASQSSPLRDIGRDFLYALRGFRNAPAFATVAVLTLALGIGANSAIFSVVHGVLIEPLPYAAPDRLAFVYTQFPTLDFDKFWVSPPEYRGLQERVESFSAIGGWRAGAVNVASESEPVRVTSSLATAELFDALGVAPLLGRTYSREEDVAGEPVVVISHGLWQSAFGGDRAIVGREIEVDGQPRTVVGVMPSTFDLEDAGIDVWEPAGIPESPTNWGSHYLNLVARVAPGITVEQAEADLSAVVTNWPETAEGHHAPNQDTHPVLMRSLAEETVGGVRTALYLLLGAVGFVLLIACANVANLLLARSESRHREVAVRAAMGAGRGRLVRQFMTESLTLGLAGGVLGLFVAWGGLRVLLTAAPDSLPRLDAIGLDGTVIAFTLGLSVLTGLAFGLAPLFHLSHTRMGSALKEGGLRTTATGSRMRLRRLLVVAEVALAVMVVVGSGLMLRSLSALQEVDPGFDPDGLLTFQLYLPAGRYEDAGATAAFTRDMIARLEGLPGVGAVAAMSGLPPLRQVDANDTEFEDYEPGGPGDPVENVDYYQQVHGDYFTTMGIPIVAGRAFRPGDEDPSNPVAVINERLARTFFPDTDPLGRRVQPSGAPVWLTIVGVAADVKQGGVEAPTGTELYFYNPQVAAFGIPRRSMNFVVRTDRPPLTLASEVRSVVREMDRSLPVAGLQSMDQNMAGAITRPRFIAMLLAVFAGLALTLAAIGTYGVMAYSVAERRHEIGIRMALGARATRVIRMVLGAGIVTATMGVVIGLGGAFATTRLMESLLFGVTTTDLPTFLVAPLVLLAVAAAASLLPARRATRLDPAAVLREE
jgi:predicted permease